MASSIDSIDRPPWLNQQSRAAASRWSGCSTARTGDGPADRLLHHPIGRIGNSPGCLTRGYQGALIRTPEARFQARSVDRWPGTPGTTWPWRTAPRKTHAKGSLHPRKTAPEPRPALIRAPSFNSFSRIDWHSAAVGSVPRGFRPRNALSRVEAINAKNKRSGLPRIVPRWSNRQRYPSLQEPDTLSARERELRRLLGESTLPAGRATDRPERPAPLEHRPAQSSRDAGRSPSPGVDRPRRSGLPPVLLSDHATGTLSAECAPRDLPLQVRTRWKRRKNPPEGGCCVEPRF